MLTSPTKAELGYWIGEPFWNKGLMTEAIAAVVKFGFEKLQLSVIHATCHEENAGSIAVLAKNNFLLSGTTGHVATYYILVGK